MTSSVAPAAPVTRIAFLDYTRVIACFMVILVHSCEFFYLSGSNTSEELFWANLIDSALRASVPIFVMMSSYLLLPLKDDTGTFFKRRFSRVLIPFVIWSIAYAVLPLAWGAIGVDEAQNQLTHLLYNFNMSSGHLWFVYMFIGIYLFMPILSPWLQSVKRRHEEWFLALWFATTFYHYIRYYTGGMLGEAIWNEFSTIWYFSGFIGYVVLAHYIRQYINWSVVKSLAVGVPLFLVGWLVTYLGFGYWIERTTDMYLVEITWRFCTPNVAVMAFALFVTFKALWQRTERVGALVVNISKLSYAMYLAHIFILNSMYSVFGAIGCTPSKIFVIAISTYILTYTLVKLLSLLPKSKFLVG